MRIEAGGYFVFDASSGVYGPDSSLAFTEGGPQPHACGPNALTKLIGEHLYRLYAQLHCLRFVALRLFSVWGPGQRPDLALEAFTLELLRERQDKVGFFGHTHETGIFSDRDWLLDWLSDNRVQIPACLACVVMVGAVGQAQHPTDRRACWVLWDPDDRLVEFRKTEYDRLQAARDIVRAGLPAECEEKLLTDDELPLFRS